MTTKTKTNIFQEYQTQYFKADKWQKGEILNHVCFVTKMHKKAAIRKFGTIQKKDPWKQQREQRGKELFYTPDVTTALKEVWEAVNEVCGELLHPMIP